MFENCALPSLSISNTLIASSVLRERNSLAGRVCLRWRPGEMGTLWLWRGIRKGSALCTDMLSLLCCYLCCFIFKIFRCFTGRQTWATVWKLNTERRAMRIYTHPSTFLKPIRRISFKPAHVSQWVILTETLVCLYYRNERKIELKCII